MLRMPLLETEHLLIRPFYLADLSELHQLLDIDLASTEFGTEGVNALQERENWLRWTLLSYEELAKLNQPPYGDRAIVLKQTRQFIGSCGLVPSFEPLELLSGLHSASGEADARCSPEFGLFYALSPAYQRQGYAAEAARALIDYAFKTLNVKRIVATTTYENAASIGVMRKVGMDIGRNPYSDPPWFQVVGILENNSLASL